MTRKQQGGEPADPVTPDAAPAETPVAKPKRKNKPRPKKDPAEKQKPGPKKGSRPRSQKEDKAAYELAKRKQEALEFRLQGYTYRQIAEEMKISVTTAHNYVKDSIAEIPMEVAEDVRQMELQRIDLMQTKMMELFLESPDIALVDANLKLMMARARYVKSTHDEDGAGSFLAVMSEKLAQMVAADRPVLRPDEPVPAIPVL